jgi:hypothetical protein
LCINGKVLGQICVYVVDTESQTERLRLENLVLVIHRAAMHELTDLDDRMAGVERASVIVSIEVMSVRVLCRVFGR